MSRTCIVTFGLTALLWAGQPAGAHDFWIEPSSYRPSPGSVVRVHLRVGERFEGDPVPRRDDLIERFELQSPQRRIPVAGMDGHDPAGLAPIEGPGVYTLIYEGRGGRVELPADRFESYLKEEGLERIIEHRASRRASGQPGRERFFRCAKSMIVSGSAPPRSASAAGLTLEIVPRFDPARIRAGDRLPVTLLFRGRPLAGALVRVLSEDDPTHVGAQRTDARGEATLTAPGSGAHLVKAVWMEAAPSGSDVDWESWWASLDFEVRP